MHSLKRLLFRKFKISSLLSRLVAFNSVSDILLSEAWSVLDECKYL